VVACELERRISSLQLFGQPSLDRFVVRFNDALMPKNPIFQRIEGIEFPYGGYNTRIARGRWHGSAYATRDVTAKTLISPKLWHRHVVLPYGFAGTVG
jgi:hypothetical protein